MSRKYFPMCSTEINFYQHLPSSPIGHCSMTVMLPSSARLLTSSSFTDFPFASVLNVESEKTKTILKLGIFLWERKKAFRGIPFPVKTSGMWQLGFLLSVRNLMGFLRLIWKLAKFKVETEIVVPKERNSQKLLHKKSFNTLRTADLWERNCETNFPFPSTSPSWKTL